jgi:hypothetical protein
VSGDATLPGGSFDVLVAVTENTAGLTPLAAQFRVSYPTDLLTLDNVTGADLGDPLFGGVEMGFQDIGTLGNAGNVSLTPGVYTLSFSIDAAAQGTYSIAVGDDPDSTAPLLATDFATNILHVFDNAGTSNIDLQPLNIPDATVSASLTGPVTFGQNFMVLVEVSDNPSSLTPASAAFRVSYPGDIVDVVGVTELDLGPVANSAEEGVDPAVTRDVSTLGNAANLDLTPGVFMLEFAFEPSATPGMFSISVGDDPDSTAPLLATNLSTAIPHVFDNAGVTDIDPTVLPTPTPTPFNSFAVVKTTVVSGDGFTPGSTLEVLVEVSPNNTTAIPMDAALRVEYSTDSLRFVSATAGDLGALTITPESARAIDTAFILETAGNPANVDTMPDIATLTFVVQDNPVFPHGVLVNDAPLIEDNLIDTLGREIPHVFNVNATFSFGGGIATPTPTPTFTPTPTPSPTPAPSLTTTVFDFDRDANGWVFVALPNVFDAPIPSFTPGTLNLTSVSNTNTFGLWESPIVRLLAYEVAAAPMPDGVVALARRQAAENTIVRATWDVGSDLLDRTRVPSFRLRASTLDFQRSDMIVVSSNDASVYSPTVTGQDYTLHFEAPTHIDDLRFSFEMMNFGATDEPLATLALDQVVLSTLRADDVTAAATLEATITFDASDEGWLPVTVAPFAEPVLSYDAANGRLALQNQAAATDLFGFWSSPNDGTALTMDPGRVYYAVYTVATDVTNASNVPGFRLRMNESGYRVSQLSALSSQLGSEALPSAGNPKDYVVFFPPNTAAGSSLLFSIDILATPGDDDVDTGSIFLDEVNVYSIPAN